MTGCFASGMFWRFLVNDDPRVARWIVRDADSRLNYRERRAVDEWVASGKPFHIMRDHPLHRLPIMGCALGGTPGLLRMEDLMRTWTVFGHYGDDERFLAARVYPLIAAQSLVHSDYPHRDDPRPFPTPYEDWGYVGEAWEDPATRHENWRRMLIEHGVRAGMKNTPRE